MYTVTNVLIRNNRSWKNVSFESIQIGQLLENNLAYVTLSNTISNITNQYLLSDFIGINLQSTSQLTTYFSSFSGLLPQPIIPALDLDNKKRIVYKDLFLYGLKATRGIYSNAVLTINQNYTPDLIIETPDSYPTPLETLDTSLLYLINGVITFPVYRDGKAYLIGATINLDRFTFQHISVLDFSLLGGYQKTVLTTNNVSILNSSINASTIKITSPIDLTNKTPLLVVNGYLHILDKTYSVTDNSTIVLHLDYNRMVNELYNLNIETIDWIKPLNHLNDGIDLTTIDPIKYLTTGNSAIILVNTNLLSIDKKNLIRTGFSGKYKTDIIPQGVLYLEDGTIGDYSVTEVTGYGIQVSTTIPTLKDFIKDTTPSNLLTGVNLNKQMSNYKDALALLMDIYVL